MLVKKLLGDAVNYEACLIRVSIIKFESLNMNKYGSLLRWKFYLVELSLRWETQSVDCVGSDVRPLAKLLRRLGKRHVGCNGAIDHSLISQKIKTNDAGSTL